MSKIKLESNPSGTGTFTIKSPASSTDRTLTLPDGAGEILTDASSVPKNSGSCFYARCATSIYPTAGVYTKLPFDTAVFDLDSEFDTTNNRFKPTVEGYYHLNALGRVGGTDSSRMILKFYKNGSEYKTIYDESYTSTPVDMQAGGSTLLYLNGTTDYVEVYGYLQGNGLFWNATTVNNEFSGFLVRKA